MDFLVKVHFKTGLILYRRNNTGILGISCIYTNASFYFSFSGLPVSSGSNAMICAILWVLTYYTKTVQSFMRCLLL